MGFFGAMGRMIAGKPVFEDPEASPASAAPVPPSNDRPDYKTPVDEHGYKIIPEIEIEHVHSHRDSEHMTVTAWVTNRSDTKVRIDYSRILNQKQQFNRELTPGQAHELVLYRGPTPMSDNDRHAELIFRLMTNGDLFDIHYYVGYERESDGGYLVDELRPDGPTRDI